MFARDSSLKVLEHCIGICCSRLLLMARLEPVSGALAGPSRLLRVSSPLIPSTWPAKYIDSNIINSTLHSFCIGKFMIVLHNSNKDL